MNNFEVVQNLHTMTFLAKSEVDFINSARFKNYYHVDYTKSHIQNSHSHFILFNLKIFSEIL